MMKAALLVNLKPKHKVFKTIDLFPFFYRDTNHHKRVEIVLKFKTIQFKLINGWLLVFKKVNGGS